MADGRLPFRFEKGARPMFIQSHSQSRLACAFGALAFAGLSIASALYPLIQA
jgi:hypothetical protein